MQNHLIKQIANSFKKTRQLEGQKCPYAVLLNPLDAKLLNIDSFTYLPKDGFKSIPIITKQNITKSDFIIAYSENELIDYLKQ